jgi:hypothetical protein
VRLVRPALAVASLLLWGCDSQDTGGPTREATRNEEKSPSPAATEKRVVREWITALNRGDYTQAARYFAKGAIVDQGRPIRLRDAAAARFFNATLPCRADLIAVQDEPGPKALASFALRAGPGGPCDGRVRVRVTIERARFTEWRQLPEGPEPSGPVV